MEWSSNLGIGVVVTTPHLKKVPCYQVLYRISDFDRRAERLVASQEGLWALVFVGIH
jgi:hypothetical protein